MERLGNVIVGACIEPGDFLASPIAGSEHQHRRGFFCRTPLFQHFDAVHHPQANIENDDVIGLGIAEKMPFFAVMDGIHRISVFDKCFSQLTGKIFIILDDERAQYLSLSSSTGRHVSPRAPSLFWHRW